ncbi:MAG: DUF3347 domain-containing protein [Balneolaceae bacterium]|nr:DUF3347 domain-containing protein [Balneolaceae bacterium]MCH8547700.1 DUF3347 domain-containing protein [Balneolaceae bacterium]
MIRLFSILATGLLIVTACGPSEQERNQQQQREQQMQMQLIETTAEFNSQMADLLEHYFDLKDALVESDAELAASRAEVFLAAAEDVESGSLNDETNALWIAFSDVITERTREMVGEDDVEAQRYQFEYISESMIEMVESFRPVGFTIYHQSCPMVRDGSADWLSREEEIRNPYHGDRMMNCGEIIQRI